MVKVKYWLGTLSYEEQREYWRSADELARSDPKNNLFFDEIEEFHLSNSFRRSEADSLTWKQSEFDFSVFETA